MPAKGSVPRDGCGLIGALKSGNSRKLIGRRSRSHRRQTVDASRLTRRGGRVAVDASRWTRRGEQPPLGSGG